MYQFFDYYFLQQTFSYLREKINSVVESGRENSLLLALDFYHLPSKTPFSLYFSTKQGNPLVLPSRKKFFQLLWNDKESIFFQKLLKILKGARLKEVKQEELRLILHFETLQQKFSQVSLLFELDTKYSNLFLLDKDNQIILFKHSTGGRELEVGDKYLPPPLTKYSWQEKITEEIEKKFFYLYQKKGLPLEKVYLSLFYDFSYYHYQALDLIFSEDLNKFQVFLKEKFSQKEEGIFLLKEEEFSPVLFKDKNFTNYWRQLESFSQLLEYYLWDYKREVFSRKRFSLEKKLKKKLKLLKKEWQKLTKNPPTLEKAQWYLEIGNSILAQFPNLKEVVAGAQLELENLFQGKKEKINVSPQGITYQMLSQKYFRKHHREKRKALHYQKEKENLKRKIDYLEEIIFLLEKVESEDEFSFLEEVVLEEKKFSSSNKKKNKKRKEKILIEKQIVKDKSGEEWTIYIGKSVRQNEYLLDKIAKRNDFWFHAFEVPGGHVIVKNDKGIDKLPPEISLSAARQALLASKFKNDKKGTIAYTMVKFLKKPPQRAPGFVIMSKFETMFVKLEDDLIDEAE